MVSNLNDNQCVEHTWTIPMLFQLSLLTPLIVVSSLWIGERCGGSSAAMMSIPLLLFIVATGARAAIIIREDFENDGHHTKSVMEEETHAGFTSPLYRSPPYLCGVLLFLWEHHAAAAATHAGRLRFGQEDEEDEESMDAASLLRRMTPAAAAARRRTSSNQSIGQAALSRAGGLCCRMCSQLLMLVLLLAMCVVGVGTHHTFGVRSQAWLEWTRANEHSDSSLHVAHAVLGRPLFGVVVAFWVSVATREEALCGVQALLSWRGWSLISRLSYSCYIFTYFSIWMVVPSFVVRDSLNPTGWRVRAIFVSTYVSVLLVLLVLAFLMHCLIERPCVVACRLR
jgi:peptidoglycan/LPS O-acetylase OafA/YrhL